MPDFYPTPPPPRPPNPLWSRRWLKISAISGVLAALVGIGTWLATTDTFEKLREEAEARAIAGKFRQPPEVLLETAKTYYESMKQQVPGADPHAELLAYPLEIHGLRIVGNRVPRGPQADGFLHLELEIENRAWSSIRVPFRSATVYFFGGSKLTMPAALDPRIDRIPARRTVLYTVRCEMPAPERLPQPAVMAWSFDLTHPTVKGAGTMMVMTTTYDYYFYLDNGQSY